MKIFITGGTGNIGQNVVLELLKRGHEIKLLTRNASRVPAFNSMPGVTIVEGTMHNHELINSALKDCDALIHIALGWGNDPVNMLDHDTRETASLLDMAAKNGLKNFIYTSSTAATGDLGSGLDETCAYRPGDLYGSTKAASEVYCLGFRQYYSEQGGYGDKVTLRRNIIRPGYTYSNPMVEGGASQSDQRFFNMALKIMKGEDLEFDINDGTQFLSGAQIALVYADLIESDLNEEIFFALGSNFITWADIAKKALELVPSSTSKIIVTGEEHPHSLYDVSKVKRTFGYEFDSWEGIMAHVEWNLERAKMSLEGKELYNTNHEYSYN